jgi:hypothetical protein
LPTCAIGDSVSVDVEAGNDELAPPSPPPHAVSNVATSNEAVRHDAPASLQVRRASPPLFLSFISLARQALGPAQATRLMVIGTILVRILRESSGEITRFVLVAVDTPEVNLAPFLKS